MEKTGNLELDELLSQAADYVNHLRGELWQMMSALKAQEASHVAWIEDVAKNPGILFGWAPPLPQGGHAQLNQSAEKECAEAVLRVLKRRLAKLQKAMRTHDRHPIAED